MQSNLRYIRYSRKSSEAKEKQMLSISDQNLECQKYVLREGLNIKFKFEESKTAYKPHKRPEFDKMIALIESGQADAILTWNLNRLSRNPEEGGKLLQLLQDRIIKEVRTSSGEIYTSDSDQLILQLHFGMSNQYSKNISKDVIRALNHKAERGEYPKPAPVGYENFGERGNKNIRPHSFEASLVKEAFGKVAKGIYSLGYLEKEFYRKGLKTKRGKRISKSHWSSILNNPLYYGYFKHNGEMFKGNYEPIISQSLFEAVQEALKDRSKPKNRIWGILYNGILNVLLVAVRLLLAIKQKSIKEREELKHILTYIAPNFFIKTNFRDLL